MKKFSLLLLLLISTLTCFSQIKLEREFRIKKSEFPSEALSLIKTKLTDAKKIKFYKEIDSSKVTFEAKFKKKRLWYSVEFNEQGHLQDIEVLIKSIDIPNDTFENATKYLDQNFEKYKIVKIQQQYPVIENDEKTINNAFQNLMLPTVNYEIMINGKKEKNFEKFEILFDATGKFKSIRKSLPINYDHVLY